MDNQPAHELDKLQKIAIGLMAVMMIITFVAANLHAVLWQSSKWLVSTVLPAVVVTLTNEERADLNAAPLQRSETLDRAARLKAQHMAANEYFAHYAPDGTSPWYWFDQAGYVYAHAGENLAIHFTDSSEVVEAWMDSPTHRENIVNTRYTEIGVGTAKGKFEGYDTVYVVQLFGAPAAVPLRAAIPSTPPPTPAPVIEPTPLPTPAPEPILAVAPVEEEPVITDTVLAAESDLTQIPVLPEGSPDLAVQTDETAVTASETVPDDSVVAEPVNSEPAEVVVFESALATSSGLAVGSVSIVQSGNGPSALTFVATKPNTLLQIIYLILGGIVSSLLLASLIMEARRTHYMQVAYSFALLLGMAGLWFVHSLLTSGAVIA